MVRCYFPGTIGISFVHLKNIDQMLSTVVLQVLYSNFKCRTEIVFESFINETGYS